MREIRKTLQISLFLIFLVLLFCIGPVSAIRETIVNITNNDNSYAIHESVATGVGGGLVNFTALWFKEVGSYNQVRNFNMHFIKGYVTAWVGPNQSSETVYGWIGNNLVSIGELGWQRSDYYGGGQFWYDIDYWNSTVSGETTVNLSTQFDNGVQATKNAKYQLFPVSYLDIEWNTLQPTNWWGNSYDAAFHVGDITAGFPTINPGGSYYITYYRYWQNDIRFKDYGSYANIYIDKYIFNPVTIHGAYYWSQVMINQTVNYQNVTIYNDKGRSMVSLPQITSGPVYFMFWDGDGNYYYYTWTGLTQIYGLTVSKGLSEINKLAVDEPATATLTGSLNGTVVAKVFWSWTERADDSSSNANIGSKWFVFNQTNRSTSTPWDIIYYTVNKQNQYDTSPTTFPRPANVYDTQHISVRFNWSDGSIWWPANHPPNNFVQATLFDGDNNQIVGLQKNVWVGTSLTNATATVHIMNTQTGSYLNNASLHIYDEDDAVYIINSQYIDSARQFEAPFNHQYVIWATHEGYSQSYTRVQGIVTYDNKYYNWTPNQYANTDIYLWMAKQGFGGNLSVVFYIKDEDNLAISNAKCVFTSHQSSDVIYSSSDYGTCSLWGISGLTYNYEISKDGYQSETGTIYLNENIAKVIILKKGVVQPTATITPTPTPTGTPGPGEPGYQPEVCANKDAISAFKCLFYSAGMQGSNAGLMLALVICAVLAFVFGYWISYQASLIGAFIGFIFSLAFGLIPMWILIALIFIGGVFFVGKWWSGAGGG